MALSFSQLAAEIRSAPQTYLPALLKATVKACIEKKVFRDNAALKLSVAIFVDEVNLSKPVESCGACCTPNPSSRKTFVVLNEKTPFGEKEHETARKVFKRNPGDGQ